MLQQPAYLTKRIHQQGIKCLRMLLHIKIKLLFYNKVAFARKNVPLYSNTRLLERDEWIFLDKDPKADRQNIIELPRSVTKGLVACRDTMTGVI